MCMNIVFIQLLNIIHNLMEPNYINIEKATIQNTDYRRVIYTVPKSFQLVLMSIPVGENIRMEKHHKTTQFIRVERGLGIAEVSGKYYALGNGISITIPPNTFHYVENVGKIPLQLYTIYTPPDHSPNLIEHKQK
jgi:mannose-6-phosphate isomerase-like protein (cupin superfamily)